MKLRLFKPFDLTNLRNISEEYRFMLESESPKELNEKIRELKFYGLGNTRNIKVIEKKLSPYILKSREILDFWGKAKTYIGESTFLIPLEKFGEIWEKFNLTVYRVSDFHGSIPEKNVDEIKIAHYFWDDLEISSKDIFITVRRLTSYTPLSPFVAKTCLNLIKIEYKDFLVFGDKKIEFEDSYLRKNVIDFKSEDYTGSLMIAHQKKIPKIFKPLSRLSDLTLIFYFTKYGVLVISVY